jgi:hypothetical protein
VSALQIRRTDIVRCFVIVGFVFSSACHQSPLVPFVRAVDQAASWAAAIRYARDLEAGHLVPITYVKQIVRDGATETETIQQTINDASGLPGDIKSKGVALCEQMTSVLNDAQTDPHALDVARLAQVEDALRALARDAGAK